MEDENEARIVIFNNVVCAHFKKSREIVRFSGREEKLLSLEIPEQVGTVHTICSQDILLVSGDKGFAIYDKNFRCLQAV